MSSGITVERTHAQTRVERMIAELGLYLWTREYASVSPLSVQVVGSLRRQRMYVGDIDLLALLPGAADKDLQADPLYQVLNAALVEPVEIKTVADTSPLWSEKGGLKYTIPRPPVAPVLRAIKGLRPGFKQASLVLLGRGDEPEIPLQVFRAEAEHWGWALARCTGPGELGELLLAHWKHTRRIGGDRRGSVDGRIVDEHGNVVPTLSEGEFFRLLGLNYCWPREREELLTRMQRARGKSMGSAAAGGDE